MEETLGARIRRLRQRYGMSQAELARRIKISGNSLNKIEMGETPDPRASRIVAIANVLGVTTDCVLKGEEKKSEMIPAA
jgi:transcriptional regulator with XRE-family HTH domain